MSTQNQAKGIDLGTTNSEIADLRGTSIHVYRNAEGAEYTPSAVFMNRANSLVVGREAKERYESDPENAFIEFKRDMGSNAEYTFARNGKKVKPEELSAEVLKSLCADTQRETGQVVSSAVITVPADFDLPQCEPRYLHGGLDDDRHEHTETGRSEWNHSRRSFLASF